MRRHPPVSMLVLAGLLLCGNAAGQPKTAADFIAAGTKAFNEDRYSEAIAAYREAYKLEASPLTLCRIAIASAYTYPFSGSFDALEVWLEEKRRLAIANGETEASWEKLPTALKAFREGARNQESQIADLRREVERLSADIVVIKKEVRRVQIDYDKAILDAKRYKDELTNLKSTIRASVDRPSVLNRGAVESDDQN